MTDLIVGAELIAEITRIAHGGEGIAVINGCVVFIHGGLPGDKAQVRIVEKQKKFARADLIKVVEPSDIRVESRCQAAAQGGGCCGFATVDPSQELSLKETIVRDQLQRVGGVQQLLVPERIDLQPSQHWRTRIRLGVDEHGRAGVRKRASNEIIIGTECSQAVTGLFDAIKDVRFSPGSEVVAVKDDFGEIHVVEISKAPRGRRSEKITRVISGDKLATQIVDGFSFRLPATGFWQAHIHAAQAYSDIISRWLEERYAAATTNAPVAWDLYGGVGVFVPALARALGNKVAIHSVESSPTCARSGEEALVGLAAKKVTFHSASVEKALGQLPHPHVVVLDPPRTGAGEDVIRAIATTDPQCIVHIGCDPATFARDIRTWSNAGYTIDKWVVVNAFPGTHHVEVLALLRPANLIDAEKR